MDLEMIQNDTNRGENSPNEIFNGKQCTVVSIELKINSNTHACSRNQPLFISQITKINKFVL